MEYIIAVLVAALTAVMSYAILDKPLADKLKFFNIASAKKEYESKVLSVNQCRLLAGIIAVLSFIAVVRIVQYVPDTIGVCKMVISLLCLTGAGCFDFRERRIPNLFPLILALGGVALLALGVALQQDGAVAYITSSAISTVGCALLLTLASVMTKQGIGAGDIKLICAFALMTGVHAVIGTLFFAVVLCSIASIIALVFKLKTLQGSFPFGPFLFFGFIITILTLNF